MKKKTPVKRAAAPKPTRKSAPAPPPPRVEVKKLKPQKKKTVPNPYAGKVRSLEEKVGHYRRALGKALYQKRMTEMALKESQKKALLAIATAATALSAAAQALAEDAESSEAPAAPAEPAKKEPAKKKPVETPKPAETPAAPPPPAEKSIMDKVRDACKEFAGINGREALREVLNKYTDKTVADIPAEKLPEFLKDLGG